MVKGGAHSYLIPAVDAFLKETNVEGGYIRVHLIEGWRAMYSIDIMTLFDLTVGDMMNESILGRAQERDFIRIEAHQIRDYTLNKQKQVDDYPYGGGRGAVMQADPLYQCWKHITDTYGPGPHHLHVPRRQDLPGGGRQAPAG